MAGLSSEWRVRPHGPLSQVDSNILTVTGTVTMPVGALPRRMTVVRLRDRRLVIFSAMALDETQMRALEEFGEPAFLVVPNDHHRLDAKSWKLRYPGIKVIAPAGAVPKVTTAVQVDATVADFNDPDVVLIDVPGTRAHEAALVVTAEGGTTLVLNDLIGNIRDAHGLSGWLLRKMGFAGDEPHIPAPVKRAIVNDKALVRDQLMTWAALPSLKRILVSHGAPIEDNPGAALRQLAESLH
jgi:hypothetical protein